MKLSCQCQNVTIDWDTKQVKFHSRCCGCDYCQQRGAEYVSDPDSSFSVQIRDSNNMKSVTHGHQTAEFHECTHCGLAYVTCKLDGQMYGIINAKVMGIDDTECETNPRDYSMETVESRLARRKENWCKVSV